jgi:hypothetical protein
MVAVAEPVPPLTPVTIPVDAPIVAMAGADEDHVPPGVALLSVVVWPTQVAAEPVIAAGGALTVTVLVAPQPVPNV